MKEPKICKCGHNKNNHYKHPEKTIKFIDSCQICPCTQYLNRKSPFKIDKVFLILGFGMIGIMAYMTIVPFTLLGFDMNQTVPIPVGILFLLLGCALALVCIYSIIPSMIISYFQAKSRREFPIEQR